MKKPSLGRRLIVIFALVPVLFISSHSLLSPVAVRADSSEILAGESTPWSAGDLLPKKDKFDPAREIKELRTKDSSTFTNDDGTRTVVMSMGPPVHYKDPASGKFEKIQKAVKTHGKPTLSARMKAAKGQGSGPGSNDTYALSNEENVLRSYFKGRSKDKNMARVEKDDFFVSWQPLSQVWADEDGNVEVIADANDVPARELESGVVYEGIFPDANEEFEVRPGRVKDNIVLNAAPFPSALSGPGIALVIEGNLTVSPGLQIWSDGTEKAGYFETAGVIELRDGNGDVAIVIEPLRVHDQAGAVAQDAYYAWDPDTGGANFSIVIPAQWLTDPARKYPVNIDPSYDLSFGNADSYISSECATDNYGLDDTIRVGYWLDDGIGWCPPHDTKYMYGLVGYSSSSALSISGTVPSCLPDAQITAASLGLFVDASDSSGTSPAVRPYRITSSWSSGSVTYNTRPSITNDSNELKDPGNGTDQWAYWNVLPSILNVHNGSSLYGFYLYQNTYSNGYNWVSFYSTNQADTCSPKNPFGWCYAYLTITYSLECTPSSTCCDGNGCFRSTSYQCSTADSCSGDSACTGYNCDGAASGSGSCNVQTGCTDCGNKDCDTLDTTCRNYDDVNIPCASGACTNPTCNAYVDSPNTTVCGTHDCDTQDTTCRNYHDITEYCNGFGGCATVSTCTDWTDASNSTVCDTYDCDYLDNVCANWNDNQGYCNGVGGCNPASTSCTDYTDNPGYGDGSYCGAVGCDYLDTTCRDYTSGYSWCLDGICQPYYCLNNYINTPAGTACSVGAGSAACGSCDGNGVCIPKSNETDCGTCALCDGAGTCNVTPSDDSACGTIDCDSFDTACRDYQNLTTNRCEAFMDCKDPNTPDCNVFVNKSTTTSCGTIDCDYLDTECSDFNDAIRYCSGTGSCNTATCGAPTFSAPGTVCTTCGGAGGCVCNGSGVCESIIPCDLDTQCDDGNICTTDTCENPGTSSSFCSNVPNSLTCGSKSCDSLDRDCRDYLEDVFTCSGAVCEDPGCVNYVEATAGASCDDNGGQVCDGVGNCVGCVDAGDCDDLNPCTQDGCTSQTCTNTIMANGAECPGGACDSEGNCIAGAIPANAGGGGGDAGCGCMVRPGEPKWNYGIAGAIYAIPFLITLALRWSVKKRTRRNKA